MTAEQFADAIGAITGEWGVLSGGQLGTAARAGQRSQPAGQRGAAPAPAAGRGTQGPRTSSDPVTSGYYVREYRNNSSHLTRALGRPIRDQVTSTRAVDATTLQALELVNGELLTTWLMRGARRMIGETTDDPLSLFNGAVAGRTPQPRHFDIDVSRASKLWVIVADTGSNAPERVLPVLKGAELVGPVGAVPLSTLTPADSSALRGRSPDPAIVAVANSSRLVYDIAGRGFTRFRGAFDVENSRAEIGSTLNPALRFFVFDAEPNMARLLPPSPELPRPAPAPVRTARAAVDRIFWAALGRAPSAAERRIAETSIADPGRPGRLSAAAVADLLWAVLMKPEFQLLY